MTQYLLWIVPLVVMGLVLYYVRSRRRAGTNVVQLSNAGTQYIDPHDLQSIAPAPVKLPNPQRRRRSAAIAAYVGFNGSAKTATMVLDTLPDLAAGRKVLSTVAFLSRDKAVSVEEANNAWAALGVDDLRPSDPLSLPHPNWIPLTDYQQILDFYDGVICMDEVQGIADSRDALGLPAPIRNILFQLRRRHVVLRWTTIDWASADKRIRRATQVVSLCRGFFPKYQPGKIWTSRRLFWIRTYDARGFEDFTEATNRVNTKNRPKPMVRQWLRLWGGLKPAILSYDSEASVLTLGASSDSGMCMTCEGKKAVKRCNCPETGSESVKKGTGRPRASGSGTGEPTPSVGSETGDGNASLDASRPPLITRRALRESRAVAA
jgi:hypothetical protein